MITRLKIEPAKCDLSGLPMRFMNPGELERLIAVVLPIEPRVVIEFGVNAGRTAKALLRNVPSIERYQGIDVLLGYVPSKHVQRNEVPIDPGMLAKDNDKFELILRSHGSLDLTPDDLAVCDVAFIDGDHSRKVVEHDTKLAEALVRPGGLIIWHDYHDLGTVDVREVLNERAAHAPLVHIEGTWLVFERRGINSQVLHPMQAS